jgi:xanthine dehydrogenase accessory factor
LKATTLKQILADKAAKQPVVLATNLATGDERLIYPDSVTASDPLMDAVRNAVKSDKSTTVATDDGEIFLNVFNPPLRMIIVGAVHIAQPLSAMASLSGYAVTIVDPREAFATKDRFPGLAISHDWPDDALKALNPDTRTAVVTLTHDPKLDDPALEIALTKPCFYIGSLGSRKTHNGRLERLREDGFDDETLARINGPVGLALGAKSPAEIAVAILAQVTATLRGAAVS